MDQEQRERTKREATRKVARIFGLPYEDAEIVVDQAESMYAARQYRTVNGAINAAVRQVRMLRVLHPGL